MSDDNKETAPESAYLASRYAQHLMGCAEIADAICQRFGVHDDSARQACFATIVIDAKERFIFTSDPEKDALAAAKADEQVKDIVPNPTPEQADAVARDTLLDGVKKVANLLNVEGFVPAMTPKEINNFIVEHLKIDTPLERLDVEELEALIKALSETLDNFKHNKKALNDAPF